jgi:PAS domain-containing protein
MRESTPRTRRKLFPGQRALSACGDGFFEFDLLGGAAWFSDWFDRKLAWRSEEPHTLGDLKPSLGPAGWDTLMGALRAHFERGVPLDVHLPVEGAAARAYWHLKGAAQRDAAGQPTLLAGCVREVPDDGDPELRAWLLRLRDAFDALPMAAAVIGGGRAVLHANRQWCALTATEVAEILEQLPDALAGTPADAPWRSAAGAHAGRLRAVPFRHEGLAYLVATLER